KKGRLQADPLSSGREWMGLIDPSGIRDTSLGYGFAPRTISASPNSCMIQAPSLRGSRNHSNDRLGESNGVLRHDRPRSAVPQTMLSPSSPSVLTAPQTIFLSHAFASGTMMPPVMRWFPQKNCLLQIGSTGTRAPLRAVL